MKKNGLEFSNGHSYEDFGLQFVKNSATEIAEVSLEMKERIEDNYNFDPLHPKQQAFESMMADCGYPNPGKIGYNFLEKYSSLFL